MEWINLVMVVISMQRFTHAQDYMELVGVGASLPVEVYEAWAPAFESYRNEFVNLDNAYFAMGSGEAQGIIVYGIEDAFNRPITYVGSDSLLTQQDYEFNPDLQMIPMLAGSVVMAYNLVQKPESYPLNLTIQHVTGIYNGSITHWNDPSIVAINPNVRLPNETFRVIARADDSGSTEIFTGTLSRYDEDWNATYGTFSEGLDADEKPIHWREDVMTLYGRTSRGMSGVILSYRNAIGYVSIADVIVCGLSYARILEDDLVLDVDLDDYVNAMERSEPYFDQYFNAELSLYVEPGEYPFIGYSYFIVNKKEFADCDLAVELVRYMEWIGEDAFARAEVEDYMLAPVTSYIADKIVNDVLKKMECDGQNLYDMVQKQKREELISSQKWRIPVYIAFPIIFLLIVLLIVYIIWQQIRLRRAILSDEWKIDKKNIVLQWTQNQGALGGKGVGSSISLALSMGSQISISAFANVWGVGTYEKKVVCLREIKVPNLYVQNKQIKRTLLWMRDKLQHNNVLRFYGIVYMGDNEKYYVSDHSPKGTLSDVVQNEKYRIDDNIKFSLAMDVANGMAFIHSQGLLHTNLSSECCYIDQRWNVRVANWENHKLDVMSKARKVSRISIVPLSRLYEDEDPNIIARRMYWTDPELLSEESLSIDIPPRKYHDVYSFGMILVEIFTREDPYSEYSMKMEPYQIFDAIKATKLKPDVNLIAPRTIRTIMLDTWDAEGYKRPTFVQLGKGLKASKQSRKGVMDSMMEVLESYANHLEEKVAERTGELDTANKALENLLHQILPRSVADSLSKGQTVEPEAYDSATIFFSDIVGFTSLSASSSPKQIVNMLNDLYTTFDSVIDHHDVYKVETIGDAYMVASGLPMRNGLLHASEIATMALDLLEAASRFKIRHRPGEKLNLRAGIHTGPVVTGVVGLKMPRYCLFGDSVNTASRMESTSEATKIQVSQTTHGILDTMGVFHFHPRGDVEVKGKGKMKTYFLLSKDGYTAMNELGTHYNTTNLRPKSHDQYIDIIGAVK